MPAPVLTPTEASVDYGLTVHQIDLNDAAAQIEAHTSYTIAEHVDLRNIYIGNVRRAWAIVASRLRSDTQGDEERFVDTETERDYSYSVNAEQRASSDLSILSGKPTELLRLGARWDDYTDRYRNGGIALVDGVRVPIITDDFGVTHP